MVYTTGHFVTMLKSFFKNSLVDNYLHLVKAYGVSVERMAIEVLLVKQKSDKIRYK